MGNCQAIDAAALVIQHPSGRLDRLYWPVKASEVMRMNPGYYVSLIIPLPLPGEENQEQKTVKFTCVKVLRPSDTLSLGHAYRLVTTQEVIKVLRAKKHAKTKWKQSGPAGKLQTEAETIGLECEAESKSNSEDHCEVAECERRQPRVPSMDATALRAKSWRPSLQSISETGS